MAEVNDEVIDDVTDVTEYNDTTDDSTDTTDEISYDQAIEWKKKAERLERAEKSLVEYKRKAKAESSSEPTTKYLTEADLERRDFLKANPELSDYTKELEQYNKKGLSLDEAKVLILSSDKARTNREKVNSLGLSDGETSKNKSSYNLKELDKLASSNPTEYARVRNEMDAGKIRLDR